MVRVAAWDPRVLSSSPVGRWIKIHQEVDSARHPSEVGKMSTSVLLRGTLHQQHSRVPTNDATSSHRLHSIERVLAFLIWNRESLETNDTHYKYHFKPSRITTLSNPLELLVGPLVHWTKFSLFFKALLYIHLLDFLSISSTFTKPRCACTGVDIILWYYSCQMILLLLLLILFVLINIPFVTMLSLFLLFIFLKLECHAMEGPIKLLYTP